MTQDPKNGEKELTGEITSNETKPELKGATLKEKVETGEISTMTPSKTEYTK